METAVVWLVGGSPEETAEARAALSRFPRVQFFANAESVLVEVTMRGRPAVLVLDWELPGAAALCRRLRDAWDETALPILAVAGPSPEAVADALAAGANDCVSMQAGTGLLVARVKVLLTIQRLSLVAVMVGVADAERFRGLADRLPQMMWMAHADGLLDYANLACRVYTGWGRHLTPSLTYRPKRFFALVHSEDEPAFMEKWHRCVSIGADFEQAVRLRRHDGAFRWHVVQARPMGVGEGQRDRWTGTCLDIDDLKQAEAAAREAEQRAAEAGARAEEASRLKDVFLATVSHELRTPLQAIMGWTRMLAAGNLDDAKRARGLEIITRNAAAQAQLIEDLLDVSRITSGTLRIEHARVSLSPIVDAAVDAVRPQAEAKGLRLERPSDGAPLYVLGDAERLRQIVSNLIGNAIKFTAAGSVRVSLARAGARVELRVEDTGQGICPEFLAHVFEPFQQADGSTTRRQAGLGLGLAIVRHLIGLHEGTIHAESPGEGRGATFVIELPSAKAPGAPESTPAPPSMECPESLAGLRVVVVDDERDAREMLHEVLASCRVEVQIAANAADGFELIRTTCPDVLLSDIAMPGEDGFSLIRRVRALPASEGGRVAAVAVTAHARIEDRERALAAGFDMHMSKPVEPNVLFAAVGRLAERLARPAPPRA